jgi:Protein of unknown function (DUF3572)
MKNFNKPQIKDSEFAKTLALEAFTYLVKEEERLFSFVHSSGIEVNDIRKLVNERGFLAAVLDYYLSDENFLLEYCNSQNVKPASVQRAAHLLGGGIWESDTP